MRTQTRALWIVIAILMILVAGSAVAETELEPGTVVFGEWFENQWYHGIILEPCGGGYIVRAETNETKCVRLNKIVLDIVPAADEVAEGAAVLAEWAPGQFYPGTVSSISGNSYDIQYDDGDRSTVTLSGIRLQGNLDAEGATVVAVTGADTGAAASQEDTVETAIVLLRDGSEWAEIQPDGTVLIEGSAVGEITADGRVYRNGNAVGEVDDDGIITMNGSRVGEIEMNGRLWRGSSPIGSVIFNGDVYLGSSKWAETDVSRLDYSEQIVVAAIVVFFAPEFGFPR